MSPLLGLFKAKFYPFWKFSRILKKCVTGHKLAGNEDFSLEWDSLETSWTEKWLVDKIRTLNVILFYFCPVLLINKIIMFVIHNKDMHYTHIIKILIYTHNILRAVN